MRMAARYAMSIAMCDHWDDGDICNATGSSWHHGCFIKADISHEVATILDLAGEMFTEAGKDLVMRRLADFTLDNARLKILEETYVWRGRAYAALGDMEKAQEDFCASLTYHEGFEPALLEIQRLGLPDCP